MYFGRLQCILQHSICYHLDSSHTTNHLVYQDKIHILNLHNVLFLMLGKSSHSLCSCSARTWWPITGPPITSTSDWSVDGGFVRLSHCVSNSVRPLCTSPRTALAIPFKTPGLKPSSTPIVFHWWATSLSFVCKTGRSSTVRTVTVKMRHQSTVHKVQTLIQNVLLIMHVIYFLTHLHQQRGKLSVCYLHDCPIIFAWWSTVYYNYNDSACCVQSAYITVPAFLF